MAFSQQFFQIISRILVNKERVWFQNFWFRNFSLLFASEIAPHLNQHILRNDFEAEKGMEIFLYVTVLLRALPVHRMLA